MKRAVLSKQEIVRHKILFISSFLIAYSIIFHCSTVLAEYVPIDISSYCNRSEQNLVEFTNYTVTNPLGGVPFDVPTSGNNYWDSHYVQWEDGLVTLDIEVGVYGVSEVHTLINCHAGTAGGPYTWLEFFGSNGAYYRKDLYANIDLRDHSPGNGYTDYINGTTTINVWPNIEWLVDKQQIILPEVFWGETLQTIRLSDNGSWPATDEIAQRSHINGLTVMTIPEPSTLLLLGIGGLFLRKKK